MNVPDSMDEARREILRRIGDLNGDMLRRRQALNEGHYYPRLAPIQADCGALGHVRGRSVSNVLGEISYVCGYCGAGMPGDDDA